jgi:hypothetical protein
MPSAPAAWPLSTRRADDDIDYTRPLDPPLLADRQQWMQTLIKK